MLKDLVIAVASIMEYTVLLSSFQYDSNAVEFHITMRLSLSLSLSVIKDRTMDNVQNCDSYIDKQSSQTYR
jgi:hypothetical protein